MEMAKTKINESKTEEQPPEIDCDSFNKFIRKAEIDASVSSRNKVDSSDSLSIGSKQWGCSSNTIKNLEGSEVGMDVSLDKSQKSITKLEERFAWVKYMPRIQFYLFCCYSSLLAESKIC